LAFWRFGVLAFCVVGVGFLVVGIVYCVLIFNRPGAGKTSATAPSYGSGGGYGGVGGTAYQNILGGTTYGQITSPSYFGSGGGGTYGGAGGGIIIINSEELILEGAVFFILLLLLLFYGV
jgi:hypothetical protein